MNVLPDFPTYVERTEPTRQKQLQSLEIDEGDDDLEWTVRDVIEELGFLVEMRTTMAPEDFREGVIEQAKRLLR